MDKKFLIVVVAIVVLFIGFLVFRPSEEAPSTSDKDQTTSHVRGSGSLLLVEFGDFQCPGCYSFKPTVDNLLAKYDGKLKFQFKHMPLKSMHQYAVTAARAAEAAGNQDKFWEMYDKIYGQSEWVGWSQGGDNPAGTFRQFAQQIGLDMAKYDAEVNSSEILAVINADASEADKLGVTGTPTFFLDGERLEVSNSVEEFSKIIDAALAKQSDD